ncbi:MAG: sigma-70 family RNA polymerase sigma factor [Planctomycetaceae bacterium]
MDHGVAEAALTELSALNDRELIGRFAANRDERAFAVVVSRHAPMVLRICRRIMKNEHDAEDACQAVFMLIARKAGHVRWHGCLANWLYGAAVRIARSDNRRLASKRTLRLADDDVVASSPAAEPDSGEIESILYQELDRLPDKFRAPLVLCYLQGRSRSQAAVELGLNETTVKGRLERARDMLLGKLARRGLVLPAALYAGQLAQEIAQAGISETTAISTAQAASRFAAGDLTAGQSVNAAALAKRELGRMFVASQIKWAVLAVAVAAALGTGAILSSQPADNQNEELRALAEGYSKNRNSFPTIDCRFECTIGKVASLDDAMKLRFMEAVPPFATKHGEWVVSGDRVLYDLQCSPEVAERVRAEIEAISRIPQTAAFAEHPLEGNDISYLRGSQHSLQYGRFFRVGNLFGPGDADAAGIRMTPFNLDLMGADEQSGPDRMLRDCISGRFVGTVAAPETTNAAKCAAVTVGHAGGGLISRYVFDPERGFLPVQWTYFENDGRVRFAVHLLEARECSGGRWFPLRSVCVLDPDGAGPHLAIGMKVTSLDVDQEPHDDRFQLALAEGATVYTPSRIGWVSIDHDRSISPSDLAGLYEQCAQAGKESAERQDAYDDRMDAENRAALDNAVSINEPRQVSYWWFLIGSLGILALVAVGLVVKRRSRTS